MNLINRKKRQKRLAQQKRDEATAKHMFNQKFRSDNKSKPMRDSEISENVNLMTNWQRCQYAKVKYKDAWKYVALVKPVKVRVGYFPDGVPLMCNANMEWN